MDALLFAHGLRDRGIEFVLRGSRQRLHVWPKKAYPHLTTEEQAFIREHTEELKALALAHALPETTVVWQPPTAAPTPRPDPSPPACSYCMRPCVGSQHPAYPVLHYDDPTEIARRDSHARSEFADALNNKRIYFGIHY